MSKAAQIQGLSDSNSFWSLFNSTESTETVNDAEVQQKRLEAVMTAIEADPDKWMQGGWHSDCGTKHCFAGWADFISGRADNSNRPDPDASDEDIEEWKANAYNRGGSWLGLKVFEGDYLFAAERTLDDFRNFIAMTPEERENFTRPAWEARQGK